MERFFRGVLKHRKLVVTIFIVITILCALCIPQVEVNGSFDDYLPEDSESTIAIDKMSEVYDTEISNVRVYVEDISLTQAEELNETFSETEGVIESTWLGDNVDIYEPLETQDQDTIDTWMDEDGYLFELTIEEPYEQEMIEELRTIAESIDGAGTVAIDGSAADTASVMESVNTDMAKIMAIAVVTVFIIMALATTSFMYPVIALISIGIAIIINLGTNIFRGEVSSITMLVAAVLQLAVSMDYSIVLLSNYQNARESISDPFEAVVKASAESFSVVISSACVTFFGFLSLACMRFLIGADMGIVLAKGVVCSFFSIMFLMPCLLYMFHNVADKCMHRAIFGHVNGFADFCRNISVPAAVIVCLLVVPCYVAMDMTDFTYGDSSNVDPDSQLGEDEEYISEKFGEEQMWVIMVPEGEWANENELVEELEDLDTTINVVSYSTVAGSATPTALADEDTLSQLISGGYSRIVLTSDVPGESEETFALVEEVRAMCEELYGDEYYLVGSSVSVYDIMTVTQDDALTVRWVSILAIALVLMVMFRSISIPIILVLTIEVSIWINLAIPYFTGESLIYIGYLVIEAVQLGAAVDYSIIYTHEYLKLRKSMPANKAARKAIAHTTLPILTSSSILMIACLGIYLASSSPMIQSIGMLLCRGALLADVLIFLILPSLFIVFDWIVWHTSIGLDFYHGDGSELAGDAAQTSGAEGAAAEGEPAKLESGEEAAATVTVDATATLDATPVAQAQAQTASTGDMTLAVSPRTSSPAPATAQTATVKSGNQTISITITITTSNAGQNEQSTDDQGKDERDA